MGRTYRGLRKEFGTKKANAHKTRSKWNARNGTRLRTLAIDLEDFKMMEANGESLHRPPDVALKPSPVVELLTSLGKPPDTLQKRVKKLDERLKTLVVVPAMKITQVVNPQKPKAAWDAEFQHVEIHVLKGRQEYACRQVKYLGRLLRDLRKLKDPSYDGAIARIEARSRRWDKVTGSIGEHLRQRREKETS